MAGPPRPAKRLESPDDSDQKTDDPFVPGAMINRFRLREGVLIEGHVQRGKRGQGPRLKELVTVEGREPDRYVEVPEFDRLTAIDPHEQIVLETESAAL